MSVNHEVKGTLARLLATEDLVVEHQKVETACFNVHSRVLTLPMWEKASNQVYDLLVGHEVGHALYTPDQDWIKENQIPPQFLNVVEDARIEKLMKRRYMGLPKTFYTGYKQLADQDFFCIGDDDIQTYNLADRVNLYFKIGNFIDIKFNEEEQVIVDKIASSETFEDALNCAKELYNYCLKQEENLKKVDVSLNSHQNEFGSGDNAIQNTENQESSNISEELAEDSKESSASGSDGKIDGSEEEQSSDSSDALDSGIFGGNQSDGQQVKTMKSFEESLKDLIDRSSFGNTYIELPDVNVDTYIISNQEIHSKCDEHWKNYIESCFFDIDKSFNKFKKDSQKEVNYLVKEFECRKSADTYSRASISRTGILDTSRLHTYKYNEDLFKKVTVIPDGKNHGLVFILDWSGSMGEVMSDTIKQLYSLIWFCKKVSIPFDVYAFTCDYPRVKYDDLGKAILPQQPYTKKDNVVAIGDWFSLMHLFTSKTNGKELQNQMKNIYRIVADFGRTFYCQYSIPAGMSLSGTPLNETLVCLHKILPEFQKQNNVQKVQCVILTDGEAPPLKYYHEVKNKWEKESFYGCRNISPGHTVLRDRKLGHTYKFHGLDMTNVLLQNLKDKFKNINFIGIRVVMPRDACQFIRKYYGFYGDEYDAVMRSWKKDKSFTIKRSGYHSYFGISSNALSSDVDFKVTEDATKSQIKSAFTKSLKNKKMNKKILGQFMELIC
jgi:hypothetical protein